MKVFASGIILALAHSSGRLVAADYYVSTGGNDTASGTESDPWATGGSYTKFFIRLEVSSVSVSKFPTYR